MIAGRRLGSLVALAFCAAGLGAAWMVYHSLAAPADVGRPVVIAGQEPAGAKAEALPPVKVFELPPLNTFKATLERPVFSRNRRPKAGAKVAVNQDLALKMRGVSGTDTDKRALLTPEGGGETLRLREGEEYQGWTVSEIGDQHVVFLRGDEKQRVDMNFKEKPPPVRKRPGQPGARQPAGGQGGENQTTQQRQNQLQKQRQQQRRLQQQRQQQQKQQQTKQPQTQQQQNQQQQNQQQQNQLRQNQLRQNLQQNLQSQ